MTLDILPLQSNIGKKNLLYIGPSIWNKLDLSNKSLKTKKVS